MRHQRGIALILVLWAGAFLTVIAVAFTFESRSEARFARNAVDQAQAAALAEGGVRRAVAGLLEPTRELRWRTDGHAYELTVGEAKLAVSVRSQRGKIDLNTAPAALLEGLLANASEQMEDFDERDAERVAHAILDWRDRDDKRRLQGAEESEYRAAGRDNAPRNAPFVTVNELRQVLGMTGPLFDLIEPAITVHSMSARLDPQTAPAIALEAVPGLDADLVAAFIEAREAWAAEAEGTTNGFPGQMLAGAERYVARSSSALYRVRAVATVPSGVIAAKSAVVRLTGAPAQPYRILWWSDTALLAADAEDNEQALGDDDRAGDGLDDG